LFGFRFKVHPRTSQPPHQCCLTFTTHLAHSLRDTGDRSRLVFKDYLPYREQSDTSCAVLTFLNSVSFIISCHNRKRLDQDKEVDSCSSRLERSLGSLLLTFLSRHIIEGELHSTACQTGELSASISSTTSHVRAVTTLPPSWLG
jgi:hypothetical protein